MLRLKCVYFAVLRKGDVLAPAKAADEVQKVFPGRKVKAVNSGVFSARRPSASASVSRDRVSAFR